MTPSQQQAKDMQDEARREQQADEKIRELEEENERLRDALEIVRAALVDFPETWWPRNSSAYNDIISYNSMVSEVQNALDGGGGDHASS